MLWVNTRIAFNGQSALINCFSYSICLWIQSWVSPRPAPPGNADLGISQHSWNFSGWLNKPCHYSCVTPWHPLMTSALCEQRCLCLSVFTQIPTQPGIKSHFLPAQTIYKGKCRCYFFFFLLFPFIVMMHFMISLLYSILSNDTFYQFSGEYWCFALLNMSFDFFDVPLLFSICFLVMLSFGGNFSLSPQRFFFFIFFFPGVALSFSFSPLCLEMFDMWPSSSRGSGAAPALPSLI